MDFLIKVALFMSVCYILKISIDQHKKNVNTVSRWLGNGDAEEGKRRGLSLLARMFKK